MANSNTNSKPLVVYTIIDREGSEKAFWVKVGAAFENKDGSMNVYLDALPVNGRIQIRKSSEKQTS